MSSRQFRDFRASSLFCQACGKAMPVRERLLLVLPDREKYEYVCTQCGDAIGTREVSAAEQIMRRESTRQDGPQVRFL